MSVRTELAKLRQQARQVRADSNVKAISDLMDELSAEAAGGGPMRAEVSLLEILEEMPTQHRPTRP
ncbi:hypothetical protein [Pseudomonas chlororaphis]|uniref:hypothetical protein n=1 Tax=Pseudomonas chlororaphis TaxID=587753 RepID=UPI002368E4A4|nr:hypothetical protein [Pseudomonas chlororaphis]WDH33912.1 hypothetical protein PUP62_24230 [Pseudomonas chlororaphis]WDH39996.1 hypothetical protein PUP51_24230 [Pseudomonas chlororaphis]